MLELRTKLNVKMKTETMNMGMEFDKGISVIGLIVNLIRFTPIDLDNAKKRITAALDKELKIKAQREADKT